MTDTHYQIETDDAIRNFRRVFLGPRGQTLMWEATYKAYGVFAALAALDLIIVVGIVGQPFLSQAVIYTLGACVLLTKGIMGRTDSETPLRALPGMAVATVKAGKSATEAHRYRYDVRGIRFVEDPWEASVQAQFYAGRTGRGREAA